MYLWAKAAHVLAVLLWMSGMLSVAHRLRARAGGGEVHDLGDLRAVDTTWTVTAMSAALALGFWMATHARWWIHPWFLGKLTLAITLSALHGGFAASLRRFVEEPARVSPRWHAYAPGIVVALMGGVVTLVILKPA